MSARFIDTSGVQSNTPQGWSPLVVKKAQIDAEIERLATQSAPPGCVRSARIVHPMSSAPGFGMSPGIDITLHVLKPGERTALIRHNSSQVSICIRGTARVQIGRRRFGVERYDVWNTPAMHPYRYENDGAELMVRLTYSNAALLEKLLIHFVEELPEAATAQGALDLPRRTKTLSRPIELGCEGAQLLGYEHLISPEVVENKAVHWPWKLIEQQREIVFPPGSLNNMGRRGLFVLYNQATGRTKGATHSFFATIGYMPSDVLDFPHRHSSNAINYALSGGFVSTVDGQRLQWDEGDIAYTAPGWSAHANGSEEKGGIALTIQDHPFQIAMESLVWQEGEGKPIRLLGAQEGFESDDSVVLPKAG